MGKPRLAVFNTQPPHLYFGGVERRIMETVKRLQTDVDITIYCGTKAGFKQPIAINGAKLVPCMSTDKVFPLDNWFFNRSLAKNVHNIETEADVFETHAVSAYGFPKKLKQIGVKKPFVHTVHGVLADEYEQTRLGLLTSREKLATHFMKYLSGLEKQTAQEASLIVTISEYSLSKLEEHYGVDKTKVRIVPNGVDIERFSPARDVLEVKRQLGLGKDPCVLFVGSLIPRKGLSFLLEAAKKVVKQRPETKFLIVGDGPLREQLDAATKQANLEGNFLFLNRIKEETLPAIYNCADVFVLPSVQEGQGIVLLEAQASGLPVVAFDIGGINESTRNGESGLLVKQKNTDALADALIKLLSDKALAKRMGNAGRRFVSNNFTWDLCAQRMLAVYHEALTF